MNRLYVFSFEHGNDRIGYSFFSKVQTYSFITDGRSVFDQTFKNGFRTYENSRKKNTTGQGDDFQLVADVLIHILKKIEINSSKCKQITST